MNQQYRKEFLEARSKEELARQNVVDPLKVDELSRNMLEDSKILDKHSKELDEHSRMEDELFEDPLKMDGLPMRRMVDPCRVEDKDKKVFMEDIKEDGGGNHHVESDGGSADKLDTQAMTVEQAHACEECACAKAKRPLAKAARAEEHAQKYALQVALTAKANKRLPDADVCMSNLPQSFGSLAGAVNAPKFYPTGHSNGPNTNGPPAHANVWTTPKFVSIELGDELYPLAAEGKSVQLN